MSQLIFNPSDNLQPVSLGNHSSTAHQLSSQEILNQFSQRALLEKDLMVLYQQAVATIKTALHLPFCRIWQVSSDGYRLHQIAGDIDPQVSQTFPLSPTAVIDSPDEVVLSQKNQLIPSPTDSETGVIVQIPGQTRWLGCIEVHAFETFEFEPECIHFLQTAGHILANATERHRLEALTATQGQILEKVAAEADVYEVFNLLCQLLEAQLPDAYCSILILDKETQQLRAGAAPTLPSAFAKGVDGLMIGSCAGSCGTAAYRGEAVFANDIANNTLWAPFRDFALSHGIQACWSTPFFSKSGEVLGTFAISHGSPCVPTDYHHAVLKVAAHLASIATEAYRTLLSRQQLHQTLEQQVTLRTAELQSTLHDLRQTQSQLIQAEKMAGLGQMVAGIAHELNNPTTFIQGNLNYLEEYVQNLLELSQLYQTAYPSIPQAAATLKDLDLEYVMTDLPKVLNSIRNGSERITDIVLGLRNFSRLDEAAQKPVDLHEGIENTLMILNHRLIEQADRVAIKVDRQYDQLPLVSCFANQLNQAVMNILTNAIDALEEKQISNPEITIRTEAQTDHVVIRITDNAGGIDPVVESRIFEPFFTTKPVGQGTGLGLSISYQIVVDRHAGHLTCLSKPGHGTEFVIEIPYKNESEM